MTLEVIWTAYKIPKFHEEIVGRSFEFNFNEISHKCSYKASSEKLLSIAKNAVLYGNSDSDYRNIESFKILSKTDIAAADKDRLGNPISFFIENVTWNDDKVIELIRHINFYNKYFDNLAPYIDIHELEIVSTSSKRGRYVDKSFPPVINARDLNYNLTSFWSAAANETDPARRFLYYYRIIEYVSFFHLDDAVKNGVHRILSGPNAYGNVHKISNRVIEMVRDARGDEYSRFKSTVIDLVELSHINREVILNAGYFAKEVSFDGGFKLKAFLENAKSSSIGAHGMENFVTTLRDIRNALSHGRDQKTGQVILPTVANLKKIQPWVDIIETAAAEVVLYEGIA